METNREEVRIKQDTQEKVIERSIEYVRSFYCLPSVKFMNEIPMMKYIAIYSIAAAFGFSKWSICRRFDFGARNSYNLIKKINILMERHSEFKEQIEFLIHLLKENETNQTP